MNSKIEALKAKHAKELAALEQEETLRAALPGALREIARIHIHDLYGSVGSITFEGPYVGPALNLDFMVSVVAAIPAVATTMVRDSCLSFRPTSYVDALPEEKKAHWQEEVSVSPLRLSIEPVTSTRLECEYYARIADQTVTVKIVMGYPPPFLGSYSAKRVEYQGGYRYESAQWRSDPKLHTIIDSSGEPVAQLESPIRWASGSDQYPNRITLYFVDLGADLDPAAVAQAIASYVVLLGSTTA